MRGSDRWMMGPNNFVRWSRQCGDTIRYSETFDVPLSDLMQAVKKHRLEGIVAKRAGSHYWSGERYGNWVKWQTDRGQEFVEFVANGTQWR
jgi:ATP-dependent DNA ligase